MSRSVILPLNSTWGELVMIVFTIRKLGHFLVDFALAPLTSCRKYLYVCFVLIYIYVYCLKLTFFLKGYSIIPIRFHDFLPPSNHACSSVIIIRKANISYMWKNIAVWSEFRFWVKLACCGVLRTRYSRIWREMWKFFCIGRACKKSNHFIELDIIIDFSMIIFLQ